MCDRRAGAVRDLSAIHQAFRDRGTTTHISDTTPYCDTDSVN